MIGGIVMHDFLGLGIGIGRFIVILLCIYFVVKWAVKKELQNIMKKKMKIISNNKLQVYF